MPRTSLACWPWQTTRTLFTISTEGVSVRPLRSPTKRGIWDLPGARTRDVLRAFGSSLIGSQYDADDGNAKHSAGAGWIMPTTDCWEDSGAPHRVLEVCQAMSSGTTVTHTELLAAVGAVSAAISAIRCGATVFDLNGQIATCALHPPKRFQPSAGETV